MAGDDWQLRKATAEDAATIAQLTRDAWTGRVHPDSSAFRETVADVVHDLEQGGGYLLLVDGKAVGSIRHSPVDGAWEVRRIGVLSPYRGKGYAALMVETVVALAQEQGVSELRLAVRQDQRRLVDFYADMGFVLAPDLKYAHANPLGPPPFVMRRNLPAAAT